MTSKIDQKYLILAGILILSAILHFYHLSEMTQFETDQEYATNFAYSVLKVYPIQLIGQGLSVQGLFMGPLYFYFLVPFFAITHLHPSGGFVGSTILGLFTVGVYFWVGKTLFGNTAGLILAALRGLLFSFLMTDWLMTPAFSSDLIVLLTWYCLYRYWHHQTNFLIPLSFLFGLYTSIHPILFPFYLVFLALLIIRKALPSIKTLFQSLIAFVLPLLPLIKFEVDHSFLEVKELFSFSAHSTVAEPRNLTRLLNLAKIALVQPIQTLGIDPKSPIMIPLAILSLALILILARKKVGFWKDPFHITMLLTTNAIFILYYFLLPSHVPEYYLLAPITLVLVYLGASLTLTPNSFRTTIIIGTLSILFLLNFNLLLARWNDPKLITLAHKEAIIKQVVDHQPKNEYFFVSYIMPYGANTGYPYLFKIYGRIPGTDVKPPVYNIVYPKISVADTFDFASGDIGLIFPK